MTPSNRFFFLNYFHIFFYSKTLIKIPFFTSCFSSENSPSESLYLIILFFDVNIFSLEKLSRGYHHTQEIALNRITQCTQDIRYRMVHIQYCTKKLSSTICRSQRAETWRLEKKQRWTLEDERNLLRCGTEEVNALARGKMR